MEDSNFKFESYIEKTKQTVWDESTSMNYPNNLYSIFEEKVPYLLDKIEQAKTIKNIPTDFIKYLTDNLKVNNVIGKCSSGYYIHTPIWYLTEDGKESFLYTAPEVKNNVWINFKMTLCWIKRLEKDFDCMKK